MVHLCNTKVENSLNFKINNLFWQIPGYNVMQPYNLFRVVHRTYEAQQTCMAPQLFNTQGKLYYISQLRIDNFLCCL